MILCLHGNLGTSRQWQPVQKNLPQKLLTYDLWPLAKANLSFQKAADTICETAATLPEKPILAGYSLGGRLALAAAATAPDLWAGALFISTHPGLNSATEKQQRQETDEVWANRALTWPTKRFLKAWNTQPVLTDHTTHSDHRRAWTLHHHRYEISKAFQLWTLGLQPDFRNSINTFPFPAIWTTGVLDQKFCHLASSIKSPQTTHICIPNTGHRLLENRPRSIATLLQKIS